MQRLFCLLNSTIGKKIIMALSGLILALFLVGHLLGNLLIFQGPGAINGYANWLQTNPLLWLIRLSMLAIVAVHIHSAIKLTRENKKARPIGYHMEQDLQVNFASKHLLLSGLVILFFILFHLAHLTLGWINHDVFSLLDKQGLPHIYARLIDGFQSIGITSVYIVGIVFIALHLMHGMKSFFQTMGFHHKNLQRLVHYLVPIVVLVICMAFAAIPLSILFGLMRRPFVL